MTDPEKLSKNAESIPILFPSDKYAQEAFTAIGETLLIKPKVFKRPVSAKVKESLEIIAVTLDSDHSMRGDDFAPDFLSDDALKWLYSEEHFYLSDLGVKPRKSKAGRLGGIIAIHPRRDEIAGLVTSELTKSWVHEAPPLFLAHISRLLTHTNSPACDNFAIEFLRHPKFWENVPANLDGNSAFICWTYAPYILKHLREAGRPFEDLMKQWVNKRKPFEHADAKYPGIEHMYKPTGRMHYLQKDGQSPSHKFIDFIVKKAILPQV